MDEEYECNTCGRGLDEDEWAETDEVGNCSACVEGLREQAEDDSAWRFFRR